jgi:hypothetical protein
MLGGKHTMGKRTTWVISAFMAVVLALVASGCGGGGSGSTGNTQPAPTPVFPGKITLFAGSWMERGTADGEGASARFTEILALAAGPDGTLYVGDGNVIRKITPRGDVSTLAGKQVAGRSGPIDGMGAAAQFCSVGGIATDSSSNVYAVDRSFSSNVAVFGYYCGANNVRKVAPDGAVSPFAGVQGYAGRTMVDGPGSAAGFVAPFPATSDEAGNVYVLDRGFGASAAIRKITPLGQVSTVVQGIQDTPATLYNGSNYSLAASQDGTLYFAHDGEIRKLPPGGTPTTLAGSLGKYGVQDGVGAAARFNTPGSMAVDEIGNLYVLEMVSISSFNMTGLVRKITPSGTVSTVAGALGPAAYILGDLPGRFDQPFALASDRRGNLYVSVGTYSAGQAILKIELPK